MKKFFSAFLLMTAMVLSVGTFVSCNDLVDEMEDVKAQATQNAADIAAIKTQITALEQGIAEAKQAAADAKTFAEKCAAEAKAEALAEAKAYAESLNDATMDELATLKGKVDGIDATLTTLKGNFDAHVVAFNEAKTAIETQLAALEKYNKETQDPKIDKLIKDLADLQTEVTNHKADFDAYKKTVDAALEDLRADIEAVDVALTVLQNNILRSLVFDPQLYVDGIESVEYNYAQYYRHDGPAAWTDDVDVKNEKNSAGVVMVQAKANTYPFNFKDSVFYAPLQMVDYYLNPSSAKIDMNKMSFLSKDARVLSTKADDWMGTDPIVESKAAEFVIDPAKSSVANGMVSVAVHPKNVVYLKNLWHTALNKPSQTDDYATVVALSVDVEKRGEENQYATITSDWARLYPTQIMPNAIAYNKVAANGDPILLVNKTYPGYKPQTCDCEDEYRTNKVGGFHLHTSIEEALANEAAFEVEYNGSIDLKKVLELHLQYERKLIDKSTVVWDIQDDADQLEKYNLKVNFELVPLQVGTNKTNDSKYAWADDAKDGVITPVAVTQNADQKYEIDYTNSIDGQISREADSAPHSAIGRCPVVLVTVTTNVDGKDWVVLHGYVKVEIVKDVLAVETDPFVWDHNYCVTPDDHPITWAKISELVLEKMSLSKDQFDKLYEPVVNDNDELVQFVKPAGAAAAYKQNWKPADPRQYLGTVTELHNWSGTTTTVLNWNLTKCDYEEIYNHDSKVPYNEGLTATIWVAFQERPSGDVTRVEYEPAIFLPLTINLSKDNADRTYGNKILDYWFGENAESARFNVERPIDNGNTINWYSNLLEVWVGNKLSWKKSGVAETDPVDLPYKFYFAPEQPEVKVLDEEGKVIKTYVLKAGSEKVFDICDGTSHDATNAGLVDLEKKYMLDANAGVYNNDVLYCEVGGVKHKIAVIHTTQDKNTGEWGYYVEYIHEENECANNHNVTDFDLIYDLLNATPSIPRTDAKLYANIGVARYSCDDVALPVADGIHPYYFLRPINVVSGDAEYLDAEANGSYLNILDILRFSDWRGEQFLTDDHKNVWYFAFYDVKQIKVDADDIMTDMNFEGKVDTWNLLKNVTKEVRISYVDASRKEYPLIWDNDEKTKQAYVNDFNLSAYNYAAAANAQTYGEFVQIFGALKYHNNGDNIKSFNLRIPIDVTYEWGTLRTVAEVKVNQTMGNDQE